MINNEGTVTYFLIEFRELTNRDLLNQCMQKHRTLYGYQRSGIVPRRLLSIVIQANKILG